MNQPCLFCGAVATLVHVHGHYQCSRCHTNALPCCDGDNCDTNQLLSDSLKKSPIEIKIQNFQKQDDSVI